MTRLNVMIAAVWLALCAICPAKAGPRDALLQYGHVAWRVSDGDLPDAPTALAQTKDGYIWIGTQSGLLRFDGTQFTPVLPLGDQRFTSDGVFALLAAPDGSLWVGTARGLGQVKDGVFSALPFKSRVNDLMLDQDGSVWLARSRVTDDKGGLCHVVGTDISCLGSSTSCRYSNAVAATAGTIWMAEADGVCSWKDHQLTKQVIAAVGSQQLAGIMDLKGDADGSLLVSFSMTGPGLGLQRYSDGHLSKVSIPGVDSETLGGAIVLRDEYRNTWIGTNQGLLRSHDGQTDRIGTAEGLTGSLMQGLLEDREGDIWVATSGGLDRFRRLPVATFGSKDGMALDRTSVVAALRDGRVLFGSSHGLSVITGSQISKLDKSNGLPGTSVTAIFQGRSSDAVWLGIDNQLVKYEKGTFSIESGAEIAAPIVAIDEDPAGALWVASSVRPPTKLFRKVAGQALVQVPSPPSALFYRMAADSMGDLWFATPAKEVFRYHDNKFSLVPPPASGSICVHDLFSPSDGSVFAPSCEGLYRYAQNQWHVLTTANGLPCNDVFSAIFDANKRLWLGLRCGYAEIAADDVIAWERDSTHQVTPVVFGAADGARLRSSDFRAAPGLAPDGTLWFSNNGPAQMIDPSSLEHNPLPPPVVIESLIADKRSVELSPDMRLSAQPGDIEIRYVGLSFPDVHKVRFRYSLSGVDSELHDAGTRRSAFYSNLGPGHYVFNVTASNNDGVWNATGARIAFYIPPRFYQTAWFWAILACLMSLLIWYLLALRTRGVAASFEERMRERLAERDRIARELHDTLLQGLQSIVLRFQVVANLMSPEDPARELQLESLAKADTVLVDVRERVRDLREAGDRVGTIVDDIQSDFDELRGSEGPLFKMMVSGTARALIPVVRAEFQSIVKEIIFNCLQHAEAREITCSIDFAFARFAVTVSDDGRGIPQDVLDAGSRIGHWGLVGIRERADKIRAAVSIISDQAGTSISVSLDARYAYASSRAWPFG